MHLNLDTNFVKRIEHWLDELVVLDCCIEVEHSDMDADQDMNWKIERDIGLNVDQQDTGLDTDFGIGLGVG